QEAKTPEDKRKVLQEKNPSPKFAPRFVALAEKDPKDPIAVDALIWVVTSNLGSQGGKDATTKALGLLVRHHITSDKLGRVCQILEFRMNNQTETFLRAVLEKNKNKDLQAEA